MHYTQCTRLVKAENRHLYIVYFVSDCAEGNIVTVCGLTVALTAAALILAKCSIYRPDSVSSENLDQNI